MRGPVRYLSEPSNWNDLSQNYTASKLWLKGQSPADPAKFIALWKQEGHSRLGVTDPRTHLAPPLGGLVVMAPVAAFPWRIARTLWLAILLISVAATIWSLLQISEFRSNQARTLAFVAACLALAPFQTGLASGNTSILIVSLCALAMWAAKCRNDATAGILFGVACSMKPHLGAFLVLYYLARRRWRLFVTAAGCTAALNLTAVLYLYLRGVSWIHDYINNATGFVTSNNIDSFTTVNPARFTLINLQVPFYSITGHSWSANLWAFAVCGFWVCLWLYWVLRRKDLVPELLSLSAISTIALLPVYHRFYDAALLAVPICWCIANFAGPCKAVARTAMLLMTPFLLPGAAFLEQLAAQNKIPDALTQSWWWDRLIMPHETWALLLLSVVLLYGMKLGQGKVTEDAGSK